MLPLHLWNLALAGDSRSICCKLCCQPSLAPALAELAPTNWQTWVCYSSGSVHVVAGSDGAENADARAATMLQQRMG